jgi:flavodoxin
MKVRGMLPLVSIVLAATVAWGAGDPPAAPVEKKALVVYFSRTGNTAEVANQIHASVVSDILRLEVQNPYPDDYEATKKRASEEQAAGFKPALKKRITNIDSYDVIFIGFPIWWAKLPPPIVSFASEHDLSGKTIVPFCTHAGSGFGQTIGELRRLYPKSTLLDGLAVWGRDARTSQDAVSEWLRRIKITN